MLEKAKEYLNRSHMCREYDAATMHCLQSIAASLIGILEHLEEQHESQPYCDKDWDMK